jgi:hypothetical protein
LTEAGGRSKEGQPVLFLKKEPKNSNPRHVTLPHGACKEIKVFCFFSSEKKILSFFL